MAAGAAGSDSGGAGTRSKSIHILPQQLSSEGFVSDVGEVAEHGNTDDVPLGDASGPLPPWNELVGGRGSGTGTRQKETGGPESGEDPSEGGVGSERGVFYFIVPLNKQNSAQTTFREHPHGTARPDFGGRGLPWRHKRLTNGAQPNRSHSRFLRVEATVAPRLLCRAGNVPLSACNREICGKAAQRVS